MATTHRSIRSFEPGPVFRTMARVGNVIMVPLLRSSVGARIPDLALLSFTGRRSGKRYSVPVGIHAFDDAHVVVTASRWRTNMRGGADVEVVHEGRERPMHAELIEDPEHVVNVYETLLQRVGVKKASRLGLRIEGDEMPTREELTGAIEGRRAVVRLTPR
jgi:hypothetical protein